MKIVLKKNPKNGNTAYYPVVTGQVAKDFDTLVDEIVSESTVTRPDVLAVLSALEEQIIYALSEGLSVRFGTLGSFHVSLTSTTTTTKEAFTVKQINAVRVQFTASSFLRKNLIPGTNPNTKLLIKA